MTASEVEEEVNKEEGISDISMKDMITLLSAKIDTLGSGFENKLK